MKFSSSANRSFRQCIERRLYLYHAHSLGSLARPYFKNHTIEGFDETEMDHNFHYAWSFKIFMDILKPFYAIPFASNHCHLHKDVFELNKCFEDKMPYLQQYAADVSEN